jgi:hypothetical protein
MKLRDPRPAVVLVTGWAGEIDTAMARRNAVDLVMTKPFDIHRVPGTVLEAAELGRARESSGEGGPA